MTDGCQLNLKPGPKALNSSLWYVTVSLYTNKCNFTGKKTHVTHLGNKKTDWI